MFLFSVSHFENVAVMLLLVWNSDQWLLVFHWTAHTEKQPWLIQEEQCSADIMLTDFIVEMNVLMIVKINHRKVV